MNNKALFLDLDWTLIRPRSFGSAEFAIDLNAPDDVEAAAYERAEGLVPRDATEVESYEDFTADGKHKIVGYKFRNIFPTSDPTDWEFLPGMPQAIREYVAEGFQVIVISNQGGIEKGFHSTAEIAGKISSVLAAVRAVLDRDLITNLYVCPSLDKENYDRKPNPGMIFRARKHQQLDLSLCLFVGDMDSDRECAKRAGVSYMDIKEFLRTHE
jgi:D-glycero-D-manno-heptose 1,7-bisphosphate phosphatase